MVVLWECFPVELMQRRGGLGRVDCGSVAWDCEEEGKGYVGGENVVEVWE